MLHDMRKGIDPKQKPAPVVTLRHVLESYLKRTDLRPKSVKAYRSAVETHLEPWLDRPLSEITREMVEERHKAIAAAVAKGGRYKGEATANGVMRVLRVLWTYQADRDGSLGANPVRLRKQWFDVPPRARLIKGDELPAFYAAVMTLPNPVQRDYVLFQLFTGMRREEAAELRWVDVDLAGKIIRVPRASTKPGRKLDLPMTSVRARSARRPPRDRRRRSCSPRTAGAVTSPNPSTRSGSSPRRPASKCRCTTFAGPSSRCGELGHIAARVEGLGQSHLGREDVTATTCR